MLKSNRKMSAIAGAVIALSGSQAFAAGLEQGTPWGAKQAGIAGAVHSSVTGSESLLYNPAGIKSNNKNPWDISLHVSPWFTQTKAATVKSDVDLKSDSTVSPVAGVTASYQLNESWGLAAGAYVAGGSASEYKSLDYSAVDTAFSTFKPDKKTNTSDTELSLGAAYKFNENFKLGLSWRASLFTGHLSSVKISYATATVPSAMTAVDLDNLKGQNYTGFRLGGQYLSDNKDWGLGFTFRNKVKAELDGNATGKIHFGTLSGLSGLGTVDLTQSANVSHVNTSIPLRIDVGGHYKITNDFTGFLSYSYINYKDNKKTTITGGPLRIPVVAGGTDVFANNAADIVFNWKDEHTVRLGGEYAFTSFVARAGYMYTSQVTATNNADPGFTPPAPMHTLSLGAGTSFMDNNLQLDAAYQYYTGSKKGHATDYAASNGASIAGVSGDRKLTSNILHFSAKYLF
jgi:hypothetical protein